MTTSKLCPNCNFENQTDTGYCTSCGASLDGQPQQQQPQQQYQPPQTFNSQANTMPNVSTQEIMTAESKATSSLIFGILSIVLSWFVIGLIFAPLAMSNAKKSQTVPDPQNQKFYIALAGKITGIIGLVFSIIGTLYWIVFALILGTLGAGSSHWGVW